MAETTSYTASGSENFNYDTKSKSKGLEKKFSGRLAEAMKILRVRKSGRHATNPLCRTEGPNLTIAELPCTGPEPPIELPCRDYIQDNRNISGIFSEYQQALFVSEPHTELRRIKRTRGERTPGTCEWVLEKGPFLNWVTGQAPQVLRIIGDADMGKTMLITFLIERLSTTLRVTSNMTLVYHFCDNENQTSNTAMSIVKTILHQLFQQQPKHLGLLQAAYDNHGHELFRDFNHLWYLLLKIIQDSGDDDLFILIDAVDKCNAHDRDLLLDGLLGIAESNGNVRFLFTCRPVEWATWGSRAQEAGLSSMTIDFRDIVNDVRKVVNDKLPGLREQYNWNDNYDIAIRNELTNTLTGAYPVYAFRVLSQAKTVHASDILQKITEDIRDIPAQLDLKRALSEHQAKDSPSFDVCSIRSLPAYSRPRSIQVPWSQDLSHQESKLTPKVLRDEGRENALEALRFLLQKPLASIQHSSSDASSSEPFSIVPTPATSRNPSQTKPGGRQTPPVSILEEEDEPEEGQRTLGYRFPQIDTSLTTPKRSLSLQSRNPFRRLSLAQSEIAVRETTNVEAVLKNSRCGSLDVLGQSKREKEVAKDHNVSPFSSSNQSLSPPLFNPAHPVSIAVGSAKRHSKDAALLFLLLIVLRPFWTYINWTWLLSIGVGLAGIACLYISHNPSVSTDYEPPANNTPHSSTSDSVAQSSTNFSAFTATIIRSYRRVLRRDDDDKGDSPSSPTPPSDPESGYTNSSDCSPDGLSFWVLSCLFIFVILGGFAVVAQTIACVRVHDESLTEGYVLPTRDDTDHWELLSNSAFVFVSMFMQSGVSLMYIYRNRSSTTSWFGVWLCTAACLATVPIALKSYLELKYVSKAVTGAGNLLQNVVTFFTLLTLEQHAQKEERRKQSKEMEALRRENEGLRRRVVPLPMSPPQTPDGSDC